MNKTYDNSISTQELCKEYDWYQNSFSDIVQNSCDDFFGANFKLNLIAISQNINYVINKEPCFVTKIGINKDYEVFFRLSAKAVKLILDKSLGELKTKFNLNKISELEAKVITSFNSNLFKAIKQNLNDPNPKELSRKNYDTVNLTFLIEENDQMSKKNGKVIVTLPKALMTPQQIVSTGEKFSENDFPQTETFAKVVVGSTKFSLYNLKNLEQGDIVVFDNSNIDTLNLLIQGQEKTFTINPNMELLISEEINEGENNMADNHNIWDNIEVEIKAEFDSVKISLGELKDIENGLVIDLASLYDNNVTLKVEGKTVASGSLVIVNDRYGVKINNVIAQASGQSEDSQEENYEENLDENESEEFDDEEFDDEDEDLEEDDEENAEGGEEFDYSDFELDDDNI